MRSFWFELAMLAVAVGALFALIPRFRPESKIVAGLAFATSVALTMSHFYLKAYTGIGLDDRVICYFLPDGPACQQIMTRHDPEKTTLSGRSNASAPDAREKEYAYWRSIQETGDVSVLVEFLRRYPEGEFASAARARIKILQDRQNSQSLARPTEREKTADVPEAPLIPQRTPLMDALRIEAIPNPDSSPDEFPVAFFSQRIREELGGVATIVQSIRLGVAFIEPRQSRAYATGGSIIGYLVLALPDLPGCTKQFGPPQRFNLQTPQLGIKKAIDSHAREIAAWLQLAISEERLTCPRS